VPAAPDDFAAFHQHRADYRIWRSRAKAAPGEPQGFPHPAQLVIADRLSLSCCGHMI
jgi:hypothetical protein